MRKFLFVFLILTSSISQATPAQGWRITGAAMYFYDNSQSTSISTTSRLIGNASLGWVFQTSPIFLGATYDYDSTTNSGSSSTKALMASYGGTFGLLTDNVLMLFTYLASSQYDSTIGSLVTTYSQGTGFQLTLGYMFNIGQTTTIGPHFKYRSVNYTLQRSPTGVTSSADLTVNSLLPYLAFNYSF